MANKFIEKLAGYASFSPEDLEMLRRSTSTEREVRARRDLIREGDRPEAVIVIQEGWAFCYKILPDGSRQITAFLMPGDTCDMHITVLGAMDHSIATLTTVRAAHLKRESIAQLLERPAIARALWTTQLVDEATLRAWIVSMGRRGSRERVAHMMCELYLRASYVGLTSEGVLKMPINQVVLADALGLTPVHVNRVLRSLRLAGVMRVTRGNLEILDPVGLTKVAGFDENYLHRRLRTVA